MLAGCGASLKQFPFDRGEQTMSVDGLEVTFFGVACFVMRWRGTAILIDPFFTMLPLLKVGFGKAESDPKQIDPYLPLLGNVESVLVGHAHYDHVLDLPYIANRIRPGADVFGSRTLQHTLAPLDLPVSFRTVNDAAASPNQRGMWLTANRGRVRVLPIQSGHPNNYAFIHLWTRRLTEDRDSPPTRAHHFHEGETFAYLVDLLEDDGRTVAHRIYVQTSSRGYPDGFFPTEVLDGRQVDIALLAMDCANIEARNERSIIDELNPSTVLFCHWENFFRSKDRPPREIVKVNLPKLHEWFEADQRADYLFPAWNSRFHFPDPVFQRRGPARIQGHDHHHGHGHGHGHHHH